MQLKIALEKVLSETHAGGKHNDVREAAQAALERLKTVQTTGDGEVARDGGANEETTVDKDGQRRVNGDRFWRPFKLALECGNPKIVETALDAVQKLIAFRALRGSLYDAKTNTLLINEIIDVVCACFVSAKTESAVQLQVIKVLLTAVTSPSCEVHETALLKAVQTCFNIFLFSRVPTNQVTAKAALTQIVNLIFQRLEKYATAVLNASAEQPAPRVADGNPVEQATPGTTAGGGAASKDGYGFCITCGKKADHYCSQTKDPVCSRECKQINLERIETDERKRREDAGTVADLEQVAEPNAAVDPARRFDNPYEPTVATYGKILRKDVFLLFRRLCLLAKSSDDSVHSQETSSNEALFGRAAGRQLRGRILALELLLAVLTNPGPVFRNNDVFISLVKKDLCLPLSKSGISPNPSLFELSLSIFLMLLSYFKAPLKSEIQLLFKDIFLKLIESPTATLTQKAMIMQALGKVCSNPQTLVDLFLNYDCDVNGDDLFESMVNVISHVTKTIRATEANEASAIAEVRKIKSRGVHALVALARSLLDWTSMTEDVGEETISVVPEASVDLVGRKPIIPDRNPLNAVSLPAVTATPLPVASPSPAADASSVLNSAAAATAPGAAAPKDAAQFEEMKSRKLGVEKFNAKPRKGIEFFQQHNFVGRDHADVARFLASTLGLQKAAIGEYLGGDDAYDVKVMHAFVDQLNFTGLAFVEALRLFLQGFRLPGESQKIDRLMEKFADRYCENNPDTFATADTAYTLAFSVIMLNTDLHSNQVKNKMTKQQFLRNNRGINNGGDVDEALLDAIYEDIAGNEIVMEEEQTAELAKAAAAGENLTSKQRNELYRMEVGQLTRKLQTLLKANIPVDFVYHSGTHADHVRPMFARSWMPMLAALSVMFEHASEADVDTVKLCLEGFSMSIKIACDHHMETEREAFVLALSKFTILSHIADMQPKNVAAIHTLLAMAYQNRNGLAESWTHVLTCVSRLERLQLIGHGASEDDANIHVTTGAARGSDEGGRHAKSQPVASQQSLLVLSGNSVHDPHTKQQLDGIIREFLSQTTVVAIDKLFSATGSLNGQAIVHFVRCLCLVSLEEVELQPRPRMYSLQKVVEIAYYNMTRIRFEWTPLWQVLQPYFQKVGCHPNSAVATAAVDSLRQLAMKFLERDELGHYHTQTEFLKPFEVIMKHSKSVAIREFALKSLEQMIRARAKNIKSGWKSIFLIYSRAAGESSKEMVAMAFSMIVAVFTEYFDHATGAFVDFVSCLVEFAFNRVAEEIAMGALHLLQSCAAQLTSAASIPSEAATLPSVETPLPDTIPEGVTEPAAGGDLSVPPAFVPVAGERHTIAPPAEGGVAAGASEGTISIDVRTTSGGSFGALTMDEFFLRWFPILSGLSRIVIDCETLSVRRKAVEVLFGLLRSSGRNYELEYWRTIFRSVLHPIFEDLRESDSRKHEVPSTIWIQALRLEVDLFTAFFSTLSAKHLLSGLVELLLIFMGQKNENLAKAGAICLHQLILRNMRAFKAPEWALLTDAIEAAFKLTTVTELMTPGPTLDFSRSVVKVAVHLELIKSLRELTVTQPVELVATIPRDSWKRWIQVSLQRVCLLQSYHFARDFNSNYDLRLSLMTSGYVAKVPNLNQQETLAFAAMLLFSFRLFQMYGDHAHGGFDDDRLFVEAHQFLAHYAGLLADAKKNERDLGARAFLVVLIFQELGALNWEDAAANKTRSVRTVVPVFYKIACQLIAADLATVRTALIPFLGQVGQSFLPAPVLPTAGASS